MHRGIVVGAHVEADRFDASELAEHRARHEVTETLSTAVAPAVDVANRRDTFFTSQQMRSGRRYQRLAFIDPMEHAVGDHRGKEEVRRLAGGFPVSVES